MRHSSVACHHSALRAERRVCRKQTFDCAVVSQYLSQRIAVSCLVTWAKTMANGRRTGQQQGSLGGKNWPRSSVGRSDRWGTDSSRDEAYAEEWLRVVADDDGWTGGHLEAGVATERQALLQLQVLYNFRFYPTSGFIQFQVLYHDMCCPHLHGREVIMVFWFCYFE